MTFFTVSNVNCAQPACRHALKGQDVFTRHMIYDYLNKVVTCPRRAACGLCDVVFAGGLETCIVGCGLAK